LNSSSGATASTVNGGFGDIQPDQGFQVLTPNTIDPRLNALAQTYQYYAFRRIVVKYIPFVGTSTTGGLYMAISKDADGADSNFAVINNSGAAASTPSLGTRQNVMEYDPSVMTAVWQPSQLTFVHGGTELWQTFPNGEEPTNERIQACLVALLEASSLVSGTNTVQVFGHVWLEYEVDFYVPGPPLSVSFSSGGEILFVPAENISVPISSSTSPLPVLKVPLPDLIANTVLQFGGSLTGGSTTTIWAGPTPLSTVTGTEVGITSAVGSIFSVIPPSAVNSAISAGTDLLIGLLSTGAAYSGATFGVFAKNQGVPQGGVP
jgi:hypothetical protein